jgi:ribosomal protein S12 methylthiotransferase
MHRNVTKEDTYALVQRFRDEVPGICLRTTMMVGFPGEGEKEFEELMDFVKWAKFDRLGAFAYCEEEGTYAAENYRDSISKKKKQERLDRLMEVQQRISTRLNDAKVGNTYKTVIDRVEGDYYIGRTEFDSPDVDTEVLIHCSEGELLTGTFYDVLIIDATEFDLMGTVVK